MDSFAPIRVSTLRGDLKIPFSAYVKVAGKMILLCREGESFEGPRLDRLKGKKIVKLFIPQEQKKAYDLYTKQNLELAYSNAKDKPLEIRTHIIHGSLQAAAEDLIEEPDAKEYYMVLIDASRRFMQFFKAEPEALQHILALKNNDFNIAHHGVTVAALSLAIYETMGIKDTRAMELESMVIGALIHDIEHNYNNLSRSTKSDVYNRAEAKVYVRHAIDGFERIKAHVHFDPLVRDIVQNHEERMDGRGPREKRERDLDPVVMIVAAANAFDPYLTYDDLSPKDALKKYLIERMGVSWLDTIKALQETLKKRGLA